eukprot:2132966-Pyramimonas_sp.AAC.1
MSLRREINSSLTSASNVEQILYIFETEGRLPPPKPPPSHLNRTISIARRRLYGRTNILTH